MSRRITIATKMDRENLVEQSLTELEAKFKRESAWFRISEAEGKRFRYTGASVNVENQEVQYDEDDVTAKNFVQNRLFQVYNKNLALDTMMMEGHEISAEYTADASTYIEGFDDIIQDGAIVIESSAGF